MQQITFGSWTFPAWAALPAAYLIWVLTLLTIKNIVYLIVRAMAAKTKTHLDDIFLKAARFPLTLLILASGGFVVQRLLPVVDQEGARLGMLGWFKAATILAIILFVDGFVVRLLRIYGERVDILRAASGIARGVVRIAVFGLGGLVLLDSFGVSITPVIASLGIGSLAVALALQPTLENLFSSIQLIVDKPFQVGHFVKLDSGEEGYVDKIGWRCSWIRMPNNNVIVMPNKILANAKLTNYHYPNKELAVLVDVGVHYNSDLDFVEGVILETAREVLRSHVGGVRDFEPMVRFHTFADFSINCTVILRALQWDTVGPLKSEFVKRLHSRFKKEGIVIPYPIEAVNYTQENASMDEDDRRQIKKVLEES